MVNSGDHFEQAALELRERLIFLCLELAPSRGTYDWLEERTGIAATKWKNLLLRRQMPTIEMILAVCFYRKGFEKWLLNGHINPGFPDFVPSQELLDAYKNSVTWDKRGAK